eukprot:scaffold28319_cov65-Cyclotella_meneghiniana.AAC.1
MEYDEVTNDQLCANKSVYAEAVMKELSVHFEHQKDSSKELEIDEDLERLEDKVRGTNLWTKFFDKTKDQYDFAFNSTHVVGPHNYMMDKDGK